MHFSLSTLLDYEAFASNSLLTEYLSGEGTSLLAPTDVIPCLSLVSVLEAKHVPYLLIVLGKS